MQERDIETWNKLKKWRIIKMKIIIDINKNGLKDKEIDCLIDSLSCLDRFDFINILEGAKTEFKGLLNIKIKREG